MFIILIQNYLHSPYQFENQIRNIWGVRKNTKRGEWEVCFEQADNSESIHRTPAGREKPLSSFKRARRYLKATQNLLPDQSPASSSAPPNPPSPILQDEAPSHESVNPVQIDKEPTDGISLPFDFESTFANSGARLSSPSHATITNTNQISFTSTHPSLVPSDPLVTDLTPAALGLPLSCNLPFDFENVSANLEIGILSPGWTTFSNQVITGCSPISGSLDYSWRGGSMPSFNRNPILGADDQQELTTSRVTLPNEQNHCYLDLRSQGYQPKLSFSSHFIRFEEFLIAKGITFTQPGLSGSRNLSSLSGDFTSKSIAEVVLSNQPYLTRRATDVAKALDRLETFIPGQSNTVITKDQAFGYRVTRILLFSMLNSFAGLDDIPAKNMLQLLGRLNATNGPFLIALKDNPSPAARTFLDTIFRASIEAKDQHTLKQLLEHRLVDVNAGIFSITGPYKETAIERAASLQAHSLSLQGYSLIATLLHYGADINKTWWKFNRRRSPAEFYGGALAKFLRNLSYKRRDNTTGVSASITATIDITKTVDLIVKAGARVTVGDLEIAGKLFTTYDMAYRLCLAILPSDHKAFFGTAGRLSYVATAATYSDDIQASQIIGSLLDLCKTACCNECLVDFAGQVEHAAILAALRGHIKVVQLLINHVCSPTKVFCAAIRSNKKYLIDFVLSFNPDLDPSAQPLTPSNPHKCTTPLAEAVGVGNEELIKYLVRK